MAKPSASLSVDIFKETLLCSHVRAGVLSGSLARKRESGVVVPREQPMTPPGGQKGPAPEGFGLKSPADSVGLLGRRMTTALRRPPCIRAFQDSNAVRANKSMFPYARRQRTPPAASSMTILRAASSSRMRSAVAKSLSARACCRCATSASISAVSSSAVFPANHCTGSA